MIGHEIKLPATFFDLPDEPNKMPKGLKEMDRQKK